MADFKTTPGVVLNNAEREIVQEVAREFNNTGSDRLLQKLFRHHLSQKLDISLQDAQVFTLC